MIIEISKKGLEKGFSSMVIRLRERTAKAWPIWERQSMVKTIVFQRSRSNIPLLVCSGV